ncbi:hypothetical protein JW721_05870 [Candidatus Micrarchaeota archaeon]|nr:hypothetical protein [Candidatus Micrarchaeota archaeon]
MDDEFIEDYGEFVDNARDSSKSLRERETSASLLLEDDFATSKLDLETLVICRLLRAQGEDLSDLMGGAATRNKLHEVRSILHKVALTENEPDVLVRVSDLLSFCGCRDSISSLILIISRDESAGSRAANAAIDAISALAVNARPKDVDVFSKRVQAARSQKEISRYYGKPLERVLSVLAQKKKCPDTPELMRWVARNKPELSGRIEGPKRRMAARQMACMGTAKR